jgi:hypothetical protein
MDAPGDQTDQTDQTDQAEESEEYERSSGLMYAVLGVALMILGSLLLAAVPISENETFVRIAALVVLGSASYMIIAGGVARGIQLARTSPRRTP